MKKVLLLTSLVLVLIGLVYFQPSTLQSFKQAANSLQYKFNKPQKLVPYEGPTKVLSLAVLEQSEWALLAEISYEHSTQVGKRVFLAADSVMAEADVLPEECESIAPLLNGTYVGRPGTIKVWVMRPSNLEGEGASTHVQLRLWDRCGSLDPKPELQEVVNYPLQVTWRALPSSIKDEVKDAARVAPIAMITIGTVVDGYELVANALIAGGHPRSRLKVLAEAGVGAGALLEILGQPDAATLAKIIQTFQEENVEVTINSFQPRSTELAINIWNAGYSREDHVAETFSEQYQSVMTEKEVYALMGLHWISPTERASQLIASAREYLDNGSRESVEYGRSLLEKAAAMDSDLPELYVEYARYYMKRSSDFSEMRKSATGEYVLGILSEAAKNYPSSADVFVLLGYVQAAQEEYDGAEKSFKKAQALGAKNWWLWNNWGLLHRKLGDDKKAIEMYAKVADQEQYTERNRLAYGAAFWEITRLLISQGEFEKSEIYFRRHHRIIPDVYGCMYRSHARMILESAGDYEKVQELAAIANTQRCPAQTELSQAYYWLWYSSAPELENRSSALLANAKMAEPDQADVWYRIARDKKGDRLLGELLAIDEKIDSVFEGNTALMLAVQANDINAAKTLLLLGANPDIQPSGNNFSPLILAVISENIPMVRLLIDHGSNPAEATAWGMSIIEMTRQSGKQELLEELLKGSRQSDI